MHRAGDRPANTSPQPGPQDAGFFSGSSFMDTFHHILNSVGIAALTLLSWVTGLLPPLAALASILWIAYQFYHSAPMEKRRAAKKEKAE